MNVIIGQVNAAQKLENIDYDLYVNNVCALLPDDIARKVGSSDVAQNILDDRYLPFDFETSEYRDIAEKIIAAIK